MCNRDSEANKKGTSNVFTIEEFWENTLRAFSLDIIEAEVRGFSMEDDPEIQFVGNVSDGRIHLTNKGRNHCEGI